MSPVLLKPLLLRPQTVRALTLTSTGLQQHQHRLFTHSPATQAPRVIDTIKTDHRELETYFNKIVSSTNPAEQAEWQNQFTWELARHSVGEELVVYPAMEKHLEDGVVITDRDRAEHQGIKEQLKTFQTLSPTDPSFLPTIKDLMQELLQHVKEEEADDLPKLQRVLSAPDSEKLGVSFERTKMFVPSRAHPSAPARPPFETAVGLMTAPVDHLADLFRKWPEKRAEVK